jgi:hypothetical protein
MEGDKKNMVEQRMRMPFYKKQGENKGKTSEKMILLYNKINEQEYYINDELIDWVGLDRIGSDWIGLIDIYYMLE